MPPASSSLLRLSNVTKCFGTPGTPGAVTVLDNLSFEARSGQSIAIVGPSGSGKSTLLHLAGALDQPTSGQVQLNGQDLAACSEAELAGIRNRRVGFVFQAHYLLPQCSVLENVLVPTLAATNGQARRDGADPGAAETAHSRALRLLQRVGLSSRLTHRPGQLSGGERQRAAVVRALINRPDLLLADEPTGSLDRNSAEHLSQLLTELNREEAVTLIVVTHSRELARHMSTAYELRSGKLVPTHIE